METNFAGKTVRAWLTNDDKENAAVRKELMRLQRECMAQKQKLVVFFSGKHDLLDSTRSLLLHNRHDRLSC